MTIPTSPERLPRYVQPRRDRPYAEAVTMPSLPPTHRPPSGDRYKAREPQIFANHETDSGLNDVYAGSTNSFQVNLRHTSYNTVPRDHDNRFHGKLDGEIPESILRWGSGSEFQPGILTSTRTGGLDISMSRSEICQAPEQENLGSCGGGCDG